MNPVFPAMKRLVRILPLFVLAAARAAAEPVVPALPEDGCVRSGVGRVLEDKLSRLDPDDPESCHDLPLHPSGAAARAFRFLAGMQREDGSWPGDPPEMATAWVLLAALYNGWSDEDEWRDAFARGVGFLVGAMREDGSFDDGPFPPELGEPRAPALALLYAADATRNPRIREAADAAARAAFGTNAPPDLFRSLELLSYHPAFGPAFRELRMERARALVPTEPRDGRPAGRWTSSPDYGELADVLPNLPSASLVCFLGGGSNRVTVCHPGGERTFVRTPETESVLATAASLLVPGAMGVVSRRPPFPTAEEVARATAPLNERFATDRFVRNAALRWLRERQAPDGSWPGDDPVVDTSLALLAFAAGEGNGGDLVYGLGTDGLSRAIRFLAASVREDGSFPVRDPDGDAASLPVLAIRACSEISPHPEVRALLRKVGAKPYDAGVEYTFGDRLALAWPGLPRADWDAFREADRRARRWDVPPASPLEPLYSPKPILHWDEPPTGPFLAEGSPLPAAAFRPLPADAAPEARALRATCRWLLVPPFRSVRPPASWAFNEVTVTARRHAEGAPAHAEDPATNAAAAEFSEADAMKALETYARIERTLCDLIRESSSPTTVSNVFAVYGAGYIHSSNAIPLLFDIIAAAGMNEPRRLYSDATPWDDPEEPPEGEVFFVSFNQSIYPKPPTPAVGALTQMPVPFDSLKRAMSSDGTDDRSRELFAWVAAAKYGPEFFGWLDGEFEANPGKWRSLKSFADKRLTGRKPFAMVIYGSHLKKVVGKDIWQFDRMVSSLRDRAKTAKKDGDETSYRRIESCLAAMGEPVEKATFQQFMDSVERMTAAPDEDESHAERAEPVEPKLRAEGAED